MKPVPGSWEVIKRLIDEAQQPKPKPKPITWELDTIVIGWMAVVVAVLIKAGVI